MDWPKDCIKEGAATLSCIPAVLQNILTWLFVFAGIAAVFFVVFAGIKFITSGGDAKQVEGARKTLTFAIIGLVIIILSYTILRLISVVTGVECILKFGFIGTC